MTKHLAPFLLLAAFLYSLCSYGQISSKGEPRSFQLNGISETIGMISLDRLDYNKLIAQDEQREDTFEPMRIGVCIEHNIDLLKEAQREAVDGGTIYRLIIESKGAMALVLYYSSFYIPQGGELFVYNTDKSDLIGAFTSLNNTSGYFATEDIEGDQIILDYFQPNEQLEKAEIIIHQIGVLYNPDRTGFGDADWCEVNVNCEEGDDWQDEKKGVARILIKKGFSLSYCTGSLLNNTRRDNTPYFLTANHCGLNSSPEDRDQWIFYFNYEAQSCENPDNEPESKTIVGAELRANSSTSNDETDFYLLELNSLVPDSYEPYYNGWSRNVTASTSGVGIHHPQGDIKKLSTYLSPLVSVNYNEFTPDPNGIYWKVVWDETQTNHGVTEGGSSGSPIFDKDGRIVGALKGGYASCDNREGPDFYGKFSYSWNSYGSEPEKQLATWLDPDNKGLMVLDGMYTSGELFIAEFTSDTTVIPVEGSVTFTDISFGSPNEWEWSFPGGSPSSSSSPNPTINYSQVGTYDVKLVVRKEQLVDSVLYSDYITVRPVVSPVPSANGYVEIFLGIEDEREFEIFVYDRLGSEMDYFKLQGPFGSKNLPLHKYSNGMYFIRVIADGYDETTKIIKVASF